MKQRDAAVLGGGCGDQRVGQRHAVVPVAALGQVTDCAHRRVSDGSIVAQDPEPVELCLDCGVLETRDVDSPSL